MVDRDCRCISVSAYDAKKIARAVRDYALSAKDSQPPWALDMARWSLDALGQVVQFPREGDWFNQNRWELTAVRVAWYTYNLYRVRHDGKRREWTDDDGRFIWWMEAEEDKEIFSPQLYYMND